MKSITDYFTFLENYNRMKKVILGIIVLVLSVVIVQAQSEIRTVEQNMSRGAQPGIAIDISDVSLDNAKQQWTKFIKQYKGKTKYDKKTMEYFTDDAKVQAISENSTDIYATIVEYKAESKITATIWFDLGGSFLNESDQPERIETAKNILNIYVKNVRVAQAEEEYQAEQKTLKQLHNDLSSLEKEKAKYEDKIADAEKLISEMKSNIATNMDQQKAKAVEIEEQQTNVNNAQSKLAKIKS